MPALVTAAAAALQEAGGPAADRPQSTLDGASAGAQMGPIEPQPTPFSALASSSLSEAPATQLSISPRAPEAMSAKFPPRLSPAGEAAREAAADAGKAGLQASRSLSERMRPTDGPPSWAGSAKRSASVARPLDHSGSISGSAATAAALSGLTGNSAELLAARSRLALERNAAVLRGLQQSMTDGSGRKVSSSASIALTQRGNSAQSSMDLYEPDAAIAAATAVAAAAAAGSDAPAARLASADKSPSKPPPFPLRPAQPARAAPAETTAQQQGEPYEDAVRHWLHSGQQFLPPAKLPTPQGSASQALPAQKFSSATASNEALGVQAVNYLAGDAPAGGDAAQDAEAMAAQLVAKEERQVLAGSLPEGLRIALGLSMGQPVGQPLRKGSHINVPHPRADAAPAAVAAEAAAGPPSLLSQAEAVAAAAGLPPLALQAQLVTSAAGGAAQQSLYVPMARTAAQIGMATAEQQAHAAAAGASQAANPLSYQFYQMLMGSLAGAAPKQQLQQQQSFLDGMTVASPAAASAASVMDVSALMRGPSPVAGGAAAMAQLLSFRAEAFAVHLSVKLFHCTPADLPEDARDQLLGWLKAAPACTELYIRSGCVHLTVTVSADPGGLCHCILRLIARTATSAPARMSCSWKAVLLKPPASLQEPAYIKHVVIYLLASLWRGVPHGLLYFYSLFVI